MYLLLTCLFTRDVRQGRARLYSLGKSEVVSVQSLWLPLQGPQAAITDPQVPRTVALPSGPGQADRREGSLALSGPFSDLAANNGFLKTTALGDTCVQI